MASIVKRTPANLRRLALSKADYTRLVGVLDSDLAMTILTEQELSKWRARLCESEIVDPPKIEPIVTIHSVVQLLDVDSGTRETFRLVLPEEANICEGELSVLSPKGAVLLGCRLGEAIVWTTGNSHRRLCVEAIQTPSDQFAGRDEKGVAMNDVNHRGVGHDGSSI